MSFLYDLFNEAVYNEVFRKFLEKNAQDSSLSTTEVAKKLVNRLSRILSGIEEPLNVSSNTTTSVDLGVNQLQNLSKLLQFMDSNKIMINGDRVAYDESEYNTLSEEERNKLSPVTVNVARDQNRQWKTSNYRTNLDLLIKYISDLKNKAHELKINKDPQGQILEVMIGKLIDSINSIKPDSGLSRVPKSVPDKPKELPEDTILDFFENKIFDINNPFSDKGSKVLLSKNLISKESLNAWMRQAPEAQILISSNKLVKYTDPEANHCNVINVLYKRAYNLARTASSPEETKKYNFYLEKISQIGSTFTDPQGKACTIGAFSTGGGTYNRYNFVGTPGNENTETVSPQIIEQIVQSLPLDIQDIDFNRIRKFFSLYAKIVSRDNIQSAMTSMDTTIRLMNIALSLTNNQQIFRFTRNIEELLTWLKPPAGNNALSFLYTLQQIITEIGKVLGMFYNEFARTLYSGDRQTLNNEQKSLVEAQYLGSSSIYSQNLREIQSLIANFRHAVDTKK